MSYQIEFKGKGDSETSWIPWAQKYPTLEALNVDWGGPGNVLNTDEFDFRIVEADSTPKREKN